jgi:ubiquinone/menaquinone biosynthesis C-methylase UbiE
VGRKEKLFDDWPERYDRWFTTPIGGLVRKFEADLVLGLLGPGWGERLLDAGCGTGVFTIDFLAAGAAVTGLDISLPMLEAARRKAAGRPFFPVLGDMLRLPFPDNTFDKTVSITALEFIADAGRAIDELFRVTRPGGRVVLATLNSLSPWASRRRGKAGEHVLKDAFYRSPEELLSYGPQGGTAATAVHFQKDEDPAHAAEIEEEGRARGLDTGAFVVVAWVKPRLSR